MSWNTINITYTECVSNLNYSPRKARCGLPFSTLFSTVSYKTHDYVKKLFSGIYVFCFLNNAVREFFILKNFYRHLIKNFYRSSSTVLRREAESSEVGILNWSEKISDVESSELQQSEVNWTKQSEVEWGEVKCSIGKLKGTSLYGKSL